MNLLDKLRETEGRRYAAAGVVLLVIIVMFGFLTYQPLPAGNRDLLVAIVAIFTSQSATLFKVLFGDQDQEKTQLKSELSHMQAELTELRSKYDTLDAMHTRLVNMLVERHIISGEGYATHTQPPAL
jgi:hypothetical protein